jgi:hypothetical protein
MEIDVDLSCGRCVSSVFRAIGRVMDECPGAGNISDVYVFELADAAGGVAATIQWEFSPDDELTAIFRGIWDAETQMVECVLNHESPICRPDVPACVQDFYSRN